MRSFLHYPVTLQTPVLLAVSSVEPTTTLTMSPLKEVTETVSKLDRFWQQDKEASGEDGGASAGETESMGNDTAKALEAISSCQTTLTTKIEGVKVDISLIL